MKKGTPDGDLEQPHSRRPGNHLPCTLSMWLHERDITLLRAQRKGEARVGKKEEEVEMGGSNLAGGAAAICWRCLPPLLSPSSSFFVSFLFYRTLFPLLLLVDIILEQRLTACQTDCRDVVGQ
jgi:hypothetical protein